MNLRESAAKHVTKANPSTIDKLIAAHPKRRPEIEDLIFGHPTLSGRVVAQTLSDEFGVHVSGEMVRKLRAATR